MTFEGVAGLAQPDRHPQAVESGDLGEVIERKRERRVRRQQASEAGDEQLEDDDADEPEASDSDDDAQRKSLQENRSKSTSALGAEGKPAKRKAKSQGKPRAKRAKAVELDIPDMDAMQTLLQKVIDFQDRLEHLLGGRRLTSPAATAGSSASRSCTCQSPIQATSMSSRIPSISRQSWFVACGSLRWADCGARRTC